MTKTIEQSVRFTASPQELYDLYLDPKKHAAFTGGRVKISAKPGSIFEAFDRMLWGTTLLAIPGRQIVQRWRSCNFKDTDMDSILVLTFVPAGKGGRIELIHANVPKQDHAGVTKGWPRYYWEPLRKYLKKLRK